MSEDNGRTPPRPVVFVGLGNALLRDEAVGLRVVAALAEKLMPSSEVDCIELGNAGLALLHTIAGRQKAVLIDCALMGEPPGSLRRFTANEVRSVKMAGSSPHEADALATLELAVRLGQFPQELVLLGIQPADISPGLDLSDVLERRLTEYVQRAVDELPQRLQTEQWTGHVEDGREQPAAVARDTLFC